MAIVFAGELGLVRTWGTEITGLSENAYFLQWGCCEAIFFPGLISMNFHKFDTLLTLIWLDVGYVLVTFPVVKPYKNHL
jgi:hypothetical protein